MNIKVPKKKLPNPGASASVQTEAKKQVHTEAGNVAEKETGGEEIHPEVPTKQEEPIGSMHLKLGVTIGLPDYSSVRVDVGLTTPVNFVAEDPDEAFAEIKEWVTERLQSEANDLIEGMTNSD